MKALRTSLRKFGEPGRDMAVGVVAEPCLELRRSAPRLEYRDSRREYVVASPRHTDDALAPLFGGRSIHINARCVGPDEIAKGDLFGSAWRGGLALIAMRSGRTSRIGDARPGPAKARIIHRRSDHGDQVIARVGKATSRRARNRDGIPNRVRDSSKWGYVSSGGRGFRLHHTSPKLRDDSIC